MDLQNPSRRDLFAATGRGLLAASSAACLAQAAATPATAAEAKDERRGHQRLSLKRLHTWEAMRYGMFIHFGMSTFVGQELPDGKTPPIAYAPDRLDVDQWISVARDAGMQYAVLTAKHVAGHCLWPSKHTQYTVANSSNTADVCEQFVKACEKRGVRAGFYYCSWDNHNRFGSRTMSDPGVTWQGWSWKQYNFADAEAKEPPDSTSQAFPYTTSVYQNFQTAQVRELLTQYGPIAEVWIDIPGVLGRSYRTFHYHDIARLQPEAVIMMNSGISTGETYDVDYAWPSDLIAIERRVPPGTGHATWRTIEGKEYYMPGEVCDPIGKHWFFVPDDVPRPDNELAEQFEQCRARNVNFLLDVPPDKHGLIPDIHVQALKRLRANVKL
ncbi:MAG: alpha-L-fucosidase [Phycisphaerae bacterium]|nr:alpha-L-fucosidase [Phycisphaerae bacterium]